MDYKKIFELYGNIPPVLKGSYLHDRLLYSPLRYLMRRICTQLLFPFYYKRHKVSSQNIANNTIVSLTSFPKRLSNLWLVVESLKHQTIRAEKIILYLSTFEVKSRKDIPDSLLNEEDDLFEIRFRNMELRAHGKYYYAMSDFPNKNIVTVDDDVIYAPIMLEFLWKGHNCYPDDVISNQSCQIIQYKNGELKPYKEWNRLVESDFNLGYCLLNNLIPMGVGGVLYPPYVLYKDALDYELFKKLSFYADDLWLYSQIVMNERKVVLTSFDTAQNIPVYIKNNITLTEFNVYQNNNDVQICKLREYYLKTHGIDIVCPID